MGGAAGQQDRGSGQAYPEHDKLTDVRDKSQTVGEFLEWMVAVKGFRICETDGAGMFLARLDIEGLAAEFFGVDLDRLEEEKSRMLSGGG